MLPAYKNIPQHQIYKKPNETVVGEMRTFFFSFYLTLGGVARRQWLLRVWLPWAECSRRAQTPTQTHKHAFNPRHKTLTRVEHATVRPSLPLTISQADPHSLD